VSLLNDKSLLERQLANPIINGLAVPKDWYAEDSPIQSSSVDLHIGKIFLPGKTGKAEGSADCPIELHALEPGQTAIVSTLEELCLPNDIGAFGFPPSRVSVTGLLMTNPGHVDPGYAGPLRFTVINMGKTDFVLRRNDSIVTLLFIKLIQAAEKDWLQRRGGRRGSTPKQSDLNLLSPDFLDVKSRAATAAKTEIEAAGIKLKAREVIVSLVSAALGAGLLGWITGIQDLKSKVDALEKSLNVTQVQQQVTDMDRRLKIIEQARPAGDKNPPSTNTNLKWGALWHQECFCWPNQHSTWMFFSRFSALKL
jgi:dCTP deaminase